MIEVFVGNLPSRATVQDVRDLFNAADNLKRKGGWLGRQGKRLLRRLLRHPAETGPRFYLIETHHGRFPRYIRISAFPRQQGQQLIARLVGINLLGKALEIREYQSRNPANDRRRAGWHFRRWLGVERRAAERRRVA
jgi:hypothetical protein